MRWSDLLSFGICSLLVAIAVPSAASSADTPERLTAAVETLNALSEAPDKGIPQDILEKAQCVVVVPSLKSAALGIGGEYGRGFASCRTSTGWSGPAGVKVEGGSIGFQIGGSETEVVLLVMNKKGMDRLLGNQFKLGAEATVAAGPIGRSASAETDAAMRAEILSYSRARGAFAGVAVTGSTLREDGSANEDLYGKEIPNRTILSGSVPAPASTSAFTSAIRRLQGRT